MATEAEALTWRRCELADIGTVESDGSPDAEKYLGMLADYFRQFAAPIVPPTANSIHGARCHCGVALTGWGGSFTYGLSHGEGACRQCGRAGRADHYVRDPDGGEDFLRLNRFVLLYYVDDTEAPDAL